MIFGYAVSNPGFNTCLSEIGVHTVHPDQTGFIKNRNATDNIHRLFNLISIAQGQTQKL